MSKHTKALTTAFLSLTLCAPLWAQAGGPEQNPVQQNDNIQIISPVIEVGVGAEVNSTGTHSPCASCTQNGTDTRGSDILKVGFEGISASELIDGKGEFKLRFLPISIILDDGGTENFGHIAGAEGSSTQIRQMIGALVESQYNPDNGIVSLRGKLVKIDYDRDKGTFDWRAIDASVGIRGAKAVNNGTVLSIDVSAGANFGGLHLNGMSGLSQALDIAPTMSNTLTLNPYAALKAGVYSDSIKVELITSLEQRVDLTPTSSRPVYNDDRSLNVNSTHFNGTAEFEYIFNKAGLRQMGRRLSLFADLTVDVDTLTFSQVMFGEGAPYRSFMGLAGIRAQF